jgi:hypothetical protein
VAVADGVVAFESSDATSTVVVAKTDASVQLNTVIHDASAPERFTYEVGLPAGATATSDETGGVVFQGANGELLGGAAPAWAMDASGNAVDTWYRA